MKVLKVDEKWSIEYDPEDNDRPKRLLRYGEDFAGYTPFVLNHVVAMFYALLEQDEQIKELGDMIHKRGNDIAEATGGEQ
jgi:hypothetical protein